MKRMNILWISHFLPYPPKGGSYQRSYNLLREIAKKHDVSLVAFKHKTDLHPENEANEAKIELEKFSETVVIEDISSRTSTFTLYNLAFKSLFGRNPIAVNLFKSEKMHQIIQEILRKHHFDIMHIDTISLAEYCEGIQTIPIILNHHNIESHMMRRRVQYEPNLPKRAYYFIEASKLRRYEENNCKRFSANLVVSEIDKNRLKDISPSSEVEIIENGVDIQYFTPASHIVKNKVIFAGGLRIYTNKDAVLYFCAQIWPLVKKEVKDLKFTVIGRDPPNRLTRMARRDRSIELLGYVDDVRPHVGESMIYVCPIRDGGGTRVKVLDALAMGKAVVSTRIGCEGINVTHGKNVLIADTPEEFTTQIVRLYKDADFRQYIGKEGRKLVEDEYCWHRIGQKLTEIYEKHAAHGAT